MGYKEHIRYDLGKFGLHGLTGAFRYGGDSHQTSVPLHPIMRSEECWNIVERNRKQCISFSCLETRQLRSLK